MLKWTDNRKEYLVALPDLIACWLGALRAYLGKLREAIYLWRGRFSFATRQQFWAIALENPRHVRRLPGRYNLKWR